MILLPGYSSRHTDDGSSILLTPYRSGSGTPEEEEELALLQKLEKSQTQRAISTPMETTAAPQKADTKAEHGGAVAARKDSESPGASPALPQRNTATPAGTTKKDLGLDEALLDGEVRYREAERLDLTKDQALSVLQKFGVTPSTPDSWAENQGIDIEGGFWSHGSWNYFRSKYGLQGKSNREVAQFMSDKANATQARKELFMAHGGKDKDRLKVLSALSDLASVAALPLDIPKAASLPIIGTALATKVGGGVKLKGLGPLKGPADLKFPPSATPLQKAEAHAYTAAANHAHRIGALSPTGRVSTIGALGAAGSSAAASERAAAVAKGIPYRGVVGHGPDTTWTGNAIPPVWLDQTRRVNSSMGGQAAHFPIGFQPTGFTVGDPRSATPMFRMNLPPARPPVVRPPLRTLPPPPFPPPYGNIEDEDRDTR